MCKSIIFRDLLIGDLNRGRKNSLLGAAGIAAAGSVIGSWLSSDSSYDAALVNAQIARETNEQNFFLQRETNRWNWQMQREQNEANKELAEQYNANQVELQNDMNEYNERMWNMANEYNSPKNQLELARQAGINPNAVLGAGNVSPVQQLSAPDQKLSQGQVTPSSAPHMSPYSIGSRDYGKMLTAAAEALSHWPEYKEKITGMKEANRALRLQNDIREYELEEKRDEAKVYDNFSIVRAVDGSGGFISGSEFENLSDADRLKYLSPSVYRNVISDKIISPEQYSSLPDEQKINFIPEYSKSLPVMEKLPVRTKSGFEAWKSFQAVGNVLSDIRADRAQNVLREKVVSGQIEDTDTIKALINMPAQQYKSLITTVEKVSEEVYRDKLTNKGLSQRLKDQDSILRYAAKQAENMADKDIISTIKKYIPEGGLRDFFVGMVTLIETLNGNSNLLKYFGR